MGNLSDWFHCPKCQKGSINAKQVLGLGNFSLDLECDYCDFRHIERDASSENWNSKITAKQYLTGDKFRAPRASRSGQKLVTCPKCGNEEVEFWVYSDNSGLGNGETVGRVRLDCSNCQGMEKTSVSHN
jgi:DNA-directed RNA polymerase subunit M/transcription elongation factor TFIIS